MHSHFKVYKPYNFLSQFITNQQKQKRTKMLGELANFPEGTMAIGRLDKDSEGLLLLTTNGKLSKLITAGNIEKEYYAQVDGEITDDSITKLQNGIAISINGKPYQTLPCKVTKIETKPEFPDSGQRIRDERHGPTSWVSITLTEGKFRQVRKMTAAAGFPTLRLVRVRIGNETIWNMQAGEVISKDQFDL